MPNDTSSDQTLEQRVQQWEREKKGLINDLQSEREKRHSLEERMSMMESSIKEAEQDQPEVPVDERVNRLARDPDGYISSIVKPEIKTLREEVTRLQMERKYERAYRWLAKAEKKDEEEIPGSDLEKEIVRIAKDHGMTSMDPVEGTKAAYKIYQQEKLERERREKEREEAISGNTSEVPPTGQRSGQTRFTKSQILSMLPAEYERNREAILEAQAKGLISDR